VKSRWVPVIPRRRRSSASSPTPSATCSARGQNLRLSVAMSSISKQYQFSFTEPWFNRPSAGPPVSTSTSGSPTTTRPTTQGDVTAAGVRFGFPTSEYGSRAGGATPSASTRSRRYSGAPASLLQQMQLYGNSTNTSLIGFTFGYNTLDDYMKPTKGALFSLARFLPVSAAGLKFLKNRKAAGPAYRPLFWDMVGSLDARLGLHPGLRRFDGADRRALLPRRRQLPRLQAGRHRSARHHLFRRLRGARAATSMPRVRLQGASSRHPGRRTTACSSRCFSDFGTLGHLDTPFRGASYNNGRVKDNLAFRASAGVSVKWKSPFGPFRSTWASRS